MRGELPVYENQYNRILNQDVSTGYQFEILEFIVAPTRNFGYEDMVNRAFYANITNQSINSIVEEVLRRGQVNEVSSTTNNILQVGANPISVATISGGWRERRYTFRMSIRCTPIKTSLYDSRNSRYDLILTGYSDPSTDFVINRGGVAVPDMNLTFHINTMKRVAVSGHDGATVSGVISNGVSTPSAFTNNNAITTSISPGDIVDSLTATEQARVYNGKAITHGSNPHNTTLGFFKNHFIGKGYVNEMINSLVDGVNTTFNTSIALANTFKGGMSGSIFSRAGTLMVNTDIESDPFIMVLTEYSARQLGTTGDPIFNLSTLQMIDPTFNSDRVEYHTGDEYNRFASDGIVSTNNTQSLYGASVMHAIATELHNIIMSLMSTKFLSVLELHMGNNYVFDGIGGHFEPWCMIPSSPDGTLRAAFAYQAVHVAPEIAAKQLYGTVTGYFKSVIDPLLSAGGIRKYTATVMADNVNDTTIVLNFEDEGDVVYRFPTFADMNYSPLVADQDTKDKMVTNMGTLASTLIDTLQHG